LHQQKGMISLSPPTICNSALLPSSESPQLLPVTLDATAVQPKSLAEDPGLSISCEVTFRHGTLRLNGTVSEKFLALLIQELKR
ncbi:hypothetical protein ABW47_22070, partial [Enterobacter hormaechei]